MALNKYKSFCFLLTILIFLLILPRGFAQESVRIMSYNMDGYLGSTPRDSYFISVLEPIQPDIFIAIEIKSSDDWPDSIRINILNQIGNDTYNMGAILGSGSNNNAIYYKPDKFELISSRRISGSNGNPRTHEFILEHISTTQLITIFGVHLPAGGDAERVAYVEDIRSITDAYVGGEFFIAAGDFNFDDATEDSFNDLVDNSNSGYFIDPEGYDGTSSWLDNDLLFTSNSQNGLNRRKDLILNSQSVVNSSGIEYITNSFTVSGNSDGTLAGVPQEYQDASNHLPVYAEYHIYDIPTPVELSLFTAVFNGNYIDLRWRTETEVNNYGFHIENRTDNSKWLTIGFVEGHGNSNSHKEYNFTDTEINRSGIIYYRLKQIDNDGTIEYSDIVTVNVNIPVLYSLGQNFPNPFNSQTKIEYTIPEKQNVSLRVYTMLGEMVKELVDEIKPAGSYSVTFDGSSSGRELPSGIYVYILQTENYSTNQKMILLK